MREWGILHLPATSHLGAHSLQRSHHLTHAALQLLVHNTSREQQLVEGATVTCAMEQKCSKKTCLVFFLVRYFQHLQNFFPVVFHDIFNIFFFFLKLLWFRLNPKILVLHSLVLLEKKKKKSMKPYIWMNVLGEYKK